jgi:hydroxypyruvate isomerase
MPKFAANLTMLFTEYDFLDRFERAAKAGFRGVEYLFPYPYKVEDLVQRLQANDLTQVLHNLPAGDWSAGERGIACLPDRVGEFRDSVGKAIEYATALKCPLVNCLAGIAPSGVDQTKLNIKLLIEPINTLDIPGFYLTRTNQAIELIDQTGSDNIFVQYDVYHMQIMEGDLARTVEKNLSRIAHIQLADNPGRNEPGTGEINYPFLFGHFDRIGYDGWIGCEYKPKGKTEEGLGWFTKG